MKRATGILVVVLALLMAASPALAGFSLYYSGSPNPGTYKISNWYTSYGGEVSTTPAVNNKMCTKNQWTSIGCSQGSGYANDYSHSPVYAWNWCRWTRKPGDNGSSNVAMGCYKKTSY